MRIMKLNSISIRRNFSLLTLIIALFYVSVNVKAQDPAGYCTVLHQPCNGDGEVQVTITEGMTLPLTFHYWSSNILHENVYSFTDIATGMDYEESNIVRVSDANYNSINLELGFEPPFIVDNYPQIYHFECPDAGAQILFTINGGVPATNVEYYYWAEFFWGAGNPLEVGLGKYSCVVYDENNCKITLPDSTLSVLGTPPFEITAYTTAASCHNGTAGITGVTDGIPPYLFQWSTGQTGNTISDLTRGYYYVTVTDAQACTMQREVFVPQDPEIDINFTISQPVCLQNNGSITAYGSGGVSPYTYLFSTGETTQTISNLSEGGYQVLVTDANGCYASMGTAINSQSPITVTYNRVNPECGESNGSINLFIEGGSVPYSVIWNTFPAQLGLSVSGLSVGNYQFTVTDSEACEKSGYVYLYHDGLDASVMSGNATCPENNGWAGVEAYSDNPPIEYLWSNGETGNIIDNISPGSYSCTIFDAAGCTLVKSEIIYELSTLNLNYSSIPASCPYTADGSLTAVPSGGTAPYSFEWADGQTGATVNNLLPGHYSVNVIDSNGCSKYRFINLGYSSASDDCYCTITGTAFEDLNDNCIFDAGENPITNIRINCPPYGSVFTDSNGEYSFLLPTGDYTLSETILGYYPLESCQSQSYNISVTAGSGCVMTYNFAHSVNPIHDVQTEITTMQNAVPGYNYIQRVMVKNAGTIAESNIQFGYSHDGQLLLESSSMTELSQQNAFLYPDWYGITESFPVLEPGQSIYMYLTYQVPTNIPLATEIVFSDTVAYESPMSNWQAEYSPWNNVVNYSTFTIGSFDPNNKEVSPKGVGTHGFITTSDSVLTYTVNFENTGSYFARKIVICDTLDTDLDWNSLQPVSSTHDCVTRITDDGVVSFTFDDIYLPYQGFGRYGSVTYSVKQKPDLAPGTEITNSAAIYFDYNEPVITNTVLNTIRWPEGVTQTGISNQYNIYPNPANNSFSIAGDNIVNISLLNSLGQIVAQTKTPNDVYIGNLSAGIYFVRIETLEGIIVKKLIKQ